MERLKPLYIVLYVLPFAAIAYDIVYWAIDADIKLSTIAQIWTAHHAESFELFKGFIQAKLGKAAWTGGLETFMTVWPAVVSLMIPPVALNLIHYIWFKMSTGKDGSYGYSRE